jgi:hypothetical protein
MGLIAKRILGDCYNGLIKSSLINHFVNFLLDGTKNRYYHYEVYIIINLSVICLLFEMNYSILYGYQVLSTTFACQKNDKMAGTSYEHPLQT